IRWLRPVLSAASTLSETPLSVASWRRLRKGWPHLARSRLVWASSTRSREETVMSLLPNSCRVEHSVSAVLLSSIALAVVTCQHKGPASANKALPCRLDVGIQGVLRAPADGVPQ